MQAIESSPIQEAQLLDDEFMDVPQGSDFPEVFL
jgi:hypothetical protein